MCRTICFSRALVEWLTDTNYSPPGQPLWTCFLAEYEQRLCDFRSQPDDVVVLPRMAEPYLHVDDGSSASLSC